MTRSSALIVTLLSCQPIAFGGHPGAGVPEALNVAPAAEGATVTADSEHESGPATRAIDGIVGEPAGPEADWVWGDTCTDGQTLWLAGELLLDALPVDATLWITCDDAFEAYLNGEQVAEGALWVEPVHVPGLGPFLKEGRNTLCVRARNRTGSAGLRAVLKVRTEAGVRSLATDGAWGVWHREPPGWPRNPTPPATAAQVQDAGTWAHGPGLGGGWRAQVYKSHPHWIWVRFRKPARIDRVVIHGGGAGVRPSGPIGDFRAAASPVRPVDYVIEHTPDSGRTFRTLASKQHGSGEDADGLEHRFPPVVTDNVRVRILRSSHPELTYHTQVAELQVFGEFVDEERAARPAAGPPPAPRLEPSPGADRLETVRTEKTVELRSPWLRAVLDAVQPRIAALAWDSLGRGDVDEDLLAAENGDGGVLAWPVLFPEAGAAECISLEVVGNVARYLLRTGGGKLLLWEIRVRRRGIDMACTLSGEEERPAPMPFGVRLPFSLAQRCTGPVAEPRDGMRAPLPLILHAADRGSLLLRCPQHSEARLEEVQRRNEKAWDALVHALPPRGNSWQLSLDVVAVPGPRALAESATTAAAPRHWLNGFQYHPWTGMLGNNMFNENTSIILYFYADLAAYTPPLPGGIAPMAMVSESVDGYLNGAPGYAKIPDLFVERWMDAAPSVLISAWNVIRVTGDMRLLHRWLPPLERLGAKIEAQDRDGNGLPEATGSGRPGDFAPCNWWDTINFGHEDAYCCALAYRALLCLADLETMAGRPGQARHFESLAERLRQAYVPAFLNPETGILAGWRDRDGLRHDYWFTWVNGIAIAYGLVPDDLANEILDRFQTKFAEVGFDRFDLGLPGNLIPIRRADYASCGFACGQGERADGSDAFQRYENGGATACFAYFYIQALYRTGRRHEADGILDKLCAGYAAGVYQNGQWNGGEWRDWNGRPTAGEGYLADAYHAQIALYTGRLGIELRPEGFHRQPWAADARAVPLALRYMGEIVESVD